MVTGATSCGAPFYAAKLAQNGGSVKKFVKDLHIFLEGGEQ